MGKFNACVFETAIGFCGLVWSADYVVSVVLPEERKSLLRKRLDETQAQLYALNEVPKWIKKTIESLQKHLAGTPQDFSKIPVQFEKRTNFQQKIYQLVRKIPSGKVMTYKEIGIKLGMPGASRAIGTAMGRNPVPLIIPCHRVVASGGRPGGFTAHGGLHTKAKLLKIEGYQLKIKNE